jgi:hypothetical protein
LTILNLIGQSSIAFLSLPTKNNYVITTGIEAFTESEFRLAEGVFPLGEGFIERKLSMKASWPSSTGEGAFAESRWDPSRRICAERPN